MTIIHARKIARQLLTVAALASAAAGMQAAYAAGPGARDPFLEGSRIGARDPFLEGSRVDARDPFLDGSRIDARDPYTDGARTENADGMRLPPGATVASIGNRDVYTEGSHTADA